MNRNSYSAGPFTICPVEDFTAFSGFSCLNPEDTDRDLDDFITQDAERHFRDRIAVTYALSLNNGPPLAFATLQNDAIVINNGNDLPEISDAYAYSAYPAVKIGRLGIHITIQRKKFGTLLLFMIKSLMLESNRTGCRFLTVDARRDKKNGIDTTVFYEKNGFFVLTCRDRTSKYVPMYFDLARMPKSAEPLQR